MPTYDYLCSACGHRFEEMHAMSAEPLKKCPSCKKQKLERLIGAGAGVIFKGSGFYQTDYKNAGAPASGGGCQPTCGTSDAPAGCKMGKKA